MDIEYKTGKNDNPWFTHLKKKLDLSLINKAQGGIVSTISFNPCILLATNGRLAFIASTADRPKPSQIDGIRNMSPFFNKGSISSICPKNSTLFFRPKLSLFFNNCFFSGPSPAIIHL